MQFSKFWNSLPFVKPRNAPSKATFSESNALLAFGNLKDEISKHLHGPNQVDELGVIWDLIMQIIFGKPMDDSKFLMERLIQLMATKNSTDPEFVHFLERILITQLWTDITKPPTMLANYSYRSDDGSHYSRLERFIQLGKAGSHYSRFAPIKTPLSKLPDATQIFDNLMKRDENVFKEHPSGISATLFYLAIIITHDLFNSDHGDPTINKNSSYVDLSPLYGRNKAEQEKVRTGVLGRLKPDTFADSRILIQPPGVGALLILFSRNHNYIADYLFQNSEDGRFKDQNNDEQLFQTARLINCGYFLRIILYNYLRTIFCLERTQSTWILDPTKPYGKSFLFEPLPTGIGNQVSLEFNYIYRWHPAIAEDDEKWINEELKRVLKTDHPEDIDVETFKKRFGEWLRNLPADPSEWTFNNMKRDENGNFPNSDIANELIKGTEKIAGAFGANNIPLTLRVVEVLGIQSARAMGVCSLNDFRKALNLVPYKSFEEMTDNNKVLVDKLKNLYGDINNIELYPGLMVEKTKPANEVGSGGLALPFTISRAILSDATNLVRNDRFFTDDANLHNIAYWNWKNLERPDKIESLASGGILHQLILKHLPDCYPENSAFALYPFTIPTKTMSNLQERGDNLWTKIDFNKPNPK
ncbi:13286_t:CDS:2 [Ambispora leptoticha]|uniref:13286_t:CDS:1 n=1 Tax=Ambispora leptoticha TaxID=144679 RepID=A0A9N8ZHK5_9GLOM|nr:13286_t:CDS:2 [Ambispora leptoticha]